ncbi:MAG: hypothetical protein Q8K32_19510 [Archangium sp.]|nr:hypothetical protein [Archangium sp.]MDP3570370.1 hypothetical protein [Archangium sp.]
MSTALTTLERFAAKQAGPHEVMRALASHPGYFVPIGFAPTLGRSEFDRIVMLSTQGGPPAGELYVFTDEACLDLVSAQPMGSFVTPVSGIELFCALPTNQPLKLKVNPGGTLEHFWFVSAEAISLARLWGRAIRLETLLANPALSKDGLHAALRTFEAFTILVHPNDAVATAQGLGGYQNPAMVFTSPDSFERVLAQAPAMRVEHLGAKALFELLPRAGVDGIVFNPLGPGPRAFFPLSLGVSVLQLA